VKELEKSKKRLATKLKQRANRERKDNTISFEELGVDQIFVDEADLYKNLFYTTKMNRIAGLPNSDSNRAFDMFMKTRYLLEQVGGRVVFATGTPISNTMAEMYTMLPISLLASSRSAAWSISMRGQGTSRRP
jgi:N12 class adenine-specific DNA methylase